MNGKVLKLFVLGLLVTIMASLVIGCGGTEQAQEETAPAQSGEPEKVYEFKLAHHEPTGSPLNIRFEEWAKEVEKKSEGRIKIKVYPGETLGKGRDMLPMIEQGVTDIGWVVIPFFPGQFLTAEGLAMPMLGAGSSKAAALTLWDLYQANEDMQQAFSKVKVVCFTASGYQFLATSKKKVEKLEDLQGLNIRVPGWGASEFMKAAGGSPIFMPPPEMYEALEKGVIDGYILDWLGTDSNRLYEVANYVCNVPIISNPQSLLMNKAKFASLPPDLQEIMDEMGGAWGSEYITSCFDESDAPGIENFTKLDKEVYELAPEEQARWKEVARPIWNMWIETNKDKIDAQQAIDQYIELVDENNRKFE
ncbi:MAG: TRAP transporter substrate-binding protein [Peptococcaceae bacterium]